MMTCAEVRPLISLFLEKETGPLETLEARRHLDDCDRCRTRAHRISGVMSVCAALPQAAPPADVASTVMQKLRAIRGSLAAGARTTGQRASLAARWSSLAVFFGAALALLARPETGTRSAIGRSIDYLAALLGGGDGTGRATDLAGGALMMAAKVLNGGLRTELPAGAGLEVVMLVQLAGTVLLIGFLLALPVAGLTAWFLRNEARRSGLPRF